MMKTNKLSFWLSSIALALSVFATSFSFFRCMPMQMDWMAILVGILAFITAILLAVQFFNYVFFNKVIKDKIKNVEASIYKRNKEYMEGIINYSDGFTIILRMTSFMAGYGVSYKMMTSALSCFCNYGREANECFDKCLNGLETIIKSFEENIDRMKMDKPINCAYLSDEVRENFRILDSAFDNSFIKEIANILSYEHDEKMKNYVYRFMEYEKRRREIIIKYNTMMSIGQEYSK